MSIIRKIVHLSSVHRPFDVRIFHKECKALATAGYDVVLSIPYEHNQIIDDVRLIGIPLPKNRIMRMTFTIWQIYSVAKKEDADVYHFHDPELLPVGWLLSFRGKKVIYDVHEDVPKQILTKHWIPQWMRKGIARLVHSVEMFVVRRLAGVVTATPAIARRFPVSKTAVVQNFPILDELYNPDAVSYSERPNKVVYTGGITQKRGICQIVQAMGCLPHHLSARLVLAGNFRPSELEQQLSGEPAWKFVDFLGWVSRQKLLDILQEARVGLVLFHPAPNHIEAQPNKLFEFMSAGLPVIASDFPLWREIVDGVGCGILVDPLDPQAIAEAIQWLLEHPEEAEAMGLRGRQAVETHYNWDLESKKLLDFYEGVLS